MKVRILSNASEENALPEIDEIPRQESEVRMNDVGQFSSDKHSSCVKTTSTPDKDGLLHKDSIRQLREDEKTNS